MSFTTALMLLFIALKLLHYIDWSWWWVLSPGLFTIGAIMFLTVIAAVKK